MCANNLLAALFLQSQQKGNQQTLRIWDKNVSEIHDNSVLNRQIGRTSKEDR